MGKSNVSGDQFPNNDIKYRYVDHGPDKKQVLAAHSTEGIVGMLNLAAHTRAGLTSELVFVDQKFRKRGIGSAMYNIGATQLGYNPIHDTARSPAGDAWARKVGGAIPEGAEKPRMQAWDIAPEDNEMAERQSANWMKGTPIDPVHAKALTPVKPKKSRSKKPVQLALDLGPNV